MYDYPKLRPRLSGPIPLPVSKRNTFYLYSPEEESLRKIKRPTALHLRKAREADEQYRLWLSKWDDPII